MSRRVDFMNQLKHNYRKSIFVVDTAESPLLVLVCNCHFKDYLLKSSIYARNFQQSLLESLRSTLFERSGRMCRLGDITCNWLSDAEHSFCHPGFINERRNHAVIPTG